MAFKIYKNNTSKTGFLIKGDTTTDVLNACNDLITKEGLQFNTQRGPVKSVKSVTMVIENPLKEQYNYPYWDKNSDDWYQSNFVKKETNDPPEIIHSKDKKYIFGFKYVWRSRYYDSGWGYIMGTCLALKKIGIDQLNLTSKNDLYDLLTKTAHYYHPQHILSVLAWKGLKKINFYLKNPNYIQSELKENRYDTLKTIINELHQNKNSRRAITPSFMYAPFDYIGGAGSVPVYQNYQLYVLFDKKSQPIGLISNHLHRCIDARGGAQLDISHDRAWGKIASQQLNLPLLKIIIYINDVHIYVKSKKGISNKNLTQKTTIENWLLNVTDSYNPKTINIKQFLENPIYQKKIDYTFQKINNY
jgi:thymidylate synthase